MAADVKAQKKRAAEAAQAAGLDGASAAAHQIRAGCKLTLQGDGQTQSIHDSETSDSAEPAGSASATITQDRPAARRNRRKRTPSPHRAERLAMGQAWREEKARDMLEAFDGSALMALGGIARAQNAVIYS